MAFSQSQKMKKDFALPLVPGMTCGEELMRRNYHRKQIHGPMLDTATKFQGVPADRTSENMTLSAYSTRRSQRAPEGTADEEEGQEDLSGKVLRFYGYTVEQVPESDKEVERVRQVVLYFYLEDGTVSVREPKQDNSGIAFRANLKRHIVPKPDGSPITEADLKVGEPISFYGQTYLLYDADVFTRDFYKQLGQEQAEALLLPDDSYTLSRKRATEKTRGLPSLTMGGDALSTFLTPEQVRATQQFLAHDREVLKCHCTWDDTDSLYGTKHYLTLYYFLSDGSIALVEKDTQNSGRDPFPNFSKRERIAKPSGPNAKFDSSTVGSVTFQENKNTVYYSAEDLRIGNVLNLFGRKILIHDYNAYTRDYLKEKFGVTEYKPLPGGTPPPYVSPGAQRRDVTSDERNEYQAYKQSELRKHRYDSTSVKFLMKLDNNKYEDEIRRFVLVFYLADNTISIFEPVVRNSGIVGGKFLQRQKTCNSEGRPFTANDFYVGARVLINSFPFVILNSDSRSLDYMETNNEEFSHSDINKIVRKMQAMLQSSRTGLAEAFRKADEHNTTGLQMEVFLSIMSNLKLELSEQEILTVLRYFDKSGESYASYEEVAARVLPEGSALASDDRPWEKIYDEGVQAENTSLNFVVDKQKEEEKKSQTEETHAAARAAKEFKDLYEQRRQLFMKEFRSITDYARDSLIGVTEFKMCLRQKLQITSITDKDMNAFCNKLFPPTLPRITYEELLRLFNGTSNLEHTLDLIIAGKSK